MLKLAPIPYGCRADPRIFICLAARVNTDTKTLKEENGKTFAKFMYSAECRDTSGDLALFGLGSGTY